MDQKMISQFDHENAMMHKDKDNERMMKVVIAVCISFVLITMTFVAAYTIRTRIWLDTICRFANQTPITEAQDGIYQQSDQGTDQ